MMSFRAGSYPGNVLKLGAIGELLYPTQSVLPSSHKLPGLYGVQRFSNEVLIHVRKSLLLSNVTEV